MEEEIWKPIEGFDNYMISNIGRVKSIDRYVPHPKGGIKINKGKLLKPSMGNYLLVSLNRMGKKYTKNIHRLVAEAFIPNPDNKPCVDHINTIRTDNRVENLRWVTESENMNNPLTKIRMTSINKKPILQFTINGEFIKKWDCAMDAERELNISGNHIGSCCNGNRKTSYGYIWRHYDLELYLESKLFKVFGIKNKKVVK